MTKVLFIVGPMLGHVGRSLVIARALAACSSHEIVFIGVDLGKRQQLIPDTFPFHNLPAQYTDELRFADDLEALLHQLSPDLICLDMTPIPWLSYVRFPEVPLVYITNFFLTRICSFETRQIQLFRNSKDQINRIRNSRGLKPIRNIKNLYEKDAVLLCDPAALIKTFMALPSNYHIVGPCLWEPEMDLPKVLDQQKDLMFVSFGSTGNRPLSHQDVEKIAHAIDVQTVVWVGGNQHHSFRQQGLINHLVYPRLPASQVITRSRFVITHGGAGSTYQALVNGSPIGVWPYNQNQNLLASIIQDSGCGVLLEDIIANVDDMKQFLAPMQTHSEELAQSLSKVNGPLNAANVIAQMLN